MNLRPKRRGSAAFEQLAVIVLVALTGAAGLRALGDAAGSAIATDAGVASSSAPTAMAVSAQAGAVELAGKAAKVVEDTSFLADDVRRVRTAKWAGERVAFGDDANPIQYALEYEGEGPAIANAYHPAGVTFAEWDAMDEAEQARRIAQQPRDGFDHVDWTTFVRREDAPSLFRDRLTKDGARWEIKTHHFVTTLDDLFDGATFLADEVWDGGFHWHASFKNDPKWAEPLLAYWQHAEEYLRLEAVGADLANVESPFLRPISDRQLVDARALLEGGEVGNPRSRFKMHQVGLRGAIYTDPARMGFEIRGANYDLGQAARMVEATTRVLERPRSARIRFNDGVAPYSVKDLAGVVHTDMVPIPDDMERILPTASDSHFTKDKLYWRMPYVKWESRPFLAGHTHGLAEARARYEAGVRALHAKEPASAEHGLPRRPVAKLLQRWANDVDLARYY